MKILRAGFMVIAASVLLACGGGGGAPQPSSSILAATTPDPNEITILAGTGVMVDGIAQSSRFLLSSLVWKVSPLDPTSPDLTLKNQDCTATNKTDVRDTTAANLGSSTWDCKLGVISSSNVTTDAVYQLMLVGTDSAGQSTTYTKTLRVQPNPALATSSNKLELGISGAALLSGGTMVTKPGQVIQLNATAHWATTNDAAPPLFYSWSLGAGSEGTATFLTSTGSVAELYITPTLKTSSLLPVTVTATGSGVTASQTAFVLVDPLAPLFPNISPQVQDVYPGCVVGIEALGGDDPALFYQWSVVSGPQVALAGVNTSKVGFFAPTDAGVLMTLRFATGYSPITAANATGPGVYYVDAFVRTSLTAAPPPSCAPTIPPKS